MVDGRRGLAATAFGRCRDWPVKASLLRLCHSLHFRFSLDHRVACSAFVRFHFARQRFRFLSNDSGLCQRRLVFAARRRHDTCSLCAAVLCDGRVEPARARHDGAFVGCFVLGTSGMFDGGADGGEKNVDADPELQRNLCSRAADRMGKASKAEKGWPAALAAHLGL